MAMLLFILMMLCIAAAAFGIWQVVGVCLLLGIGVTIAKVINDW